MAGRPAPTAPAGAVPFREYVLKVHGRCNLRCTYCYMYFLADQGWRDQPTVMAPETIARAADRIAEHAHTHRLPAVRVVLHGGEPLLAGAGVLAGVTARIRAAAGAGVEVHASIQTNATLLDEPTLDRLAAAGIRVGVSLDGGPAANDRYRRHANGRGSYAGAARGLRLLRERPGMFTGILAVLDLANDPIETYEALLEHAPPAIDLLLPHGTWDAPPPGRAPDQSTPYGDHLVRIFDHWYDAPARTVRVRLFEEIIHLVLGGQSRSESVGLSPVATIVVNVDGSLEQVDTLRSTYQGAADTGLNVFDHPLDEALRHPAIVARQSGTAALADECLQCPVLRICGGGYYPHRYRAGSFRHPSVYCADLLRLITHIEGRVRADVARLERQHGDRHLPPGTRGVV